MENQGNASLLDGSQRAEAVLVRLRYLVAAMLIAMTALFRPLATPFALLLAAGLLIANAHIRSSLRNVRDLEQGRALGRRALTIDALVVFATYVLFLFDAYATPMALVPFLVWELSIRFGNRGTVAGLLLFFSMLGLRMYAQVGVIDGGAIRPPLVLAWTSLALIMVAFAREFRANEGARLAALEERKRIAASFLTTVEEVLDHSGVVANAPTRSDVVRAVYQICEEKGHRSEALAAMIGDLIAPLPEGHTLTPREREILGLLARGHSYYRIATALVVSPSTVRNHVHNIKCKLGFSSREEIIAFARQHGFALGNTPSQRDADPSSLTVR